MYVGVSLNVMSSKRCAVDIAACFQTFTSHDVSLGHCFCFWSIICETGSHMQLITFVAFITFVAKLGFLRLHYFCGTPGIAAV